MKNNFTVVIASAIVMLSFSSCKYDSIRASGNTVAVSRTITEFNDVSVSDGIRVDAKTGSSFDSKLELEADDNIIQYVETFVERGNLKIKIRDGVIIRGNRTITVYIKTDNLASVSGSGGSRIEVDGTMTAVESSIELSGGSRFSGSVEADVVNIELSGGSNFNGRVETSTMGAYLSGGSKINIQGYCTRFDLDLSGGSNFKGYSFITDNTFIEASGGADAQLTVSQTLRVDASGGSKVRYKGDPEIRSNVSGGSEVVDAN